MFDDNGISTAIWGADPYLAMRAVGEGSGYGP